MQTLSKLQAVSGLLAAMNSAVTPAFLDSKTSLDDAFAKSGFSLKEKTDLSGDPSLVGFLVEHNDDAWSALLIEEQSLFLLDERGNRVQQTSWAQLGHTGRVWGLHQKKRTVDGLAAFVRQHKGTLAEIFVAGFIINILALFLPLFSSFVYDKVIGNGIPETLWAVSIGLFLIIVIDYFVRSLRVSAAERFSVASENDIDRAVFKKLLLSQTNSIPSIGLFLDRYKQILSCRDFLSSSYLMSLVDVPFLLFFLITIALIGGPIVFIPIILGSAMFGINWVMSSPVYDYETQSRTAGEMRFRLLTDILSSYESILGGRWKSDLAQRWRLISGAVVAAQSKSRFWRAIGMSLSGSMNFLSYVLVIIAGVYMIEDRSLTSGGLLAVTMLSSRAMSTFMSLIMLVMRYKEFTIALKELNSVLPPLETKAQPPLRGRLRGGISLTNVTCRLGSSENPIFSNINLTIRPGEAIGLVGIPGAGKTTLLRIITGILKPNEGSVLIDNIPVSDIAPEDLSDNIAYKPQELGLLEGTIEDNVRAGRDPLTVEESENILLSSGLIQSFQSGRLNWMTQVGSRGQNLSGGQRQMVSLARALVGNPAILILDEPTNGFDADLETYFTKQLAAHKGKRTLIICSHSRPLLSLCDRLVAIGNGRILADGPREKILA